ncbi:MAG TPA: alpha/beta fold hydrolase [Baekduia sp.]|nr:alpha/beta fold hydrolase [Baekduia sp.]
MTPVAYDRGGRGEPLVLLHPLGGDRHVWRPVRGLLEPHRDVIAVDLPGFGASPPVTGSAAPDDLAAAVGGLLDDLALDRPHVAGNSLGAWVALALAQQGRAATVTAIAPAGLWSRPLPPKPEVARTAARLLRPLVGPALHVESLRRAALLGVVARPENVPAADAARLVRAYADAPGFTAANRAMRAGTFTALADLDVPVTLVWPEHDRLVARVRHAPAHVRQVTLPGCGHVPMWDDPPAVAEALLDGSAAGETVAA